MTGGSRRVLVIEMTVFERDILVAPFVKGSGLGRSNGYRSRYTAIGFLSLECHTCFKCFFLRVVARLTKRLIRRRQPISSFWRCVQVLWGFNILCYERCSAW